jgi:type II secretory pathway pseudopilin PulG
MNCSSRAFEFLHGLLLANARLPKGDNKATVSARMTTITHSLSKSLFSASRAQHGFTYIGLLFFVVIVTFALSGLATAWHTMAQREREAELLFVGEQFRRAIESYFLQSPGRSKLPASLDDLLLDERHPVTKRHLRRLYRDPMTGSDGPVPERAICRGRDLPGLEVRLRAPDQTNRQIICHGRLPQALRRGECMHGQCRSAENADCRRRGCRLETAVVSAPSVHPRQAPEFFCRTTAVT